MGSGKTRPLTLDAGALIALDRGDRAVRSLIYQALGAGLEVAVPAGALAQAWRDGRRQVKLARLLAEDGVRVVDLTEVVARRSGELCGRSGSSDAIDASVVVFAIKQAGGIVLTSDPRDLRRLDPKIDLEAV